MIVDVDDALKQLLRANAGLGAEVEILLDAPTKDWAARRNGPAVNLYLYDLREDVRRRERGVVERRDESGIVISRSPAPRWFKMSYLVTAWTQRPEDEHRLLDQLLTCLLRQDAIPEALLTAAMADSRRPVILSIGLPPPEDRAFADVWSALGGELKPSLDLVVTAPADIDAQLLTGPPVTDPPRGDFGKMTGGILESHELSESLTDAARERASTMTIRPQGPG